MDGSLPMEVKPEHIQIMMDMQKGNRHYRRALKKSAGESFMLPGTNRPIINKAKRRHGR